jgi:hypothetical protein
VNFDCDDGLTSQIQSDLDHMPAVAGTVLSAPERGSGACPRCGTGARICSSESAERSHLDRFDQRADYDANVRRPTARPRSLRLIDR